MSPISKTERLFNLLAFFLTAKHPVALDEIRKIEGYQGKSHAALRQSFYRDRKELSRLGINIECQRDERGRDVYFIPSHARYLPKINFTSEEIWALSLLSHFLSTHESYPFKDDLDLALKKIFFDVDVEMRLSDLPFIIDLSPRSAAVLNYLRFLDEALQRRKRVRFSYFSVRTGKVGIREVDPYYLFEKDGSWYLVGYCHTHNHLRTYKVGRFRGNIELVNPKEEGPDFEIPSDFNPESFHDLRPWREEEGAVEVEIWVSSKISFWVQRTLKFEEVKEVEDGTIMKLKVGDVDSFLDWVLSLGENVEIKSPPFLRKEMLKIVKEIEKSYGLAGDNTSR
jgi:predicted DNA-binding transcriptional regulator YafY